MTPKKLICSNCIHFNDFSEGCDAFKNGIPNEILIGENDHSKPLPEQDNNIVFEKI
jgi:hypothetical protein